VALGRVALGRVALGRVALGRVAARRVAARRVAARRRPTPAELAGLARRALLVDRVGSSVWPAH
jgi:hypothetical protein